MPFISNQIAPFFIAGEYDDDGYGDEGGEYYEEDEMPTTTSTMMKNPFANTNFKAPQIDTSKVKTWLTDFANSPEGEQALDNLKNFAGMVGSMGKDLAMNVGSAVGESLKELKEKKKSSAGTGGSGSSIAEKYDSYTPPTTPKSSSPSFSYLEALSDDEVTEEDEDEFYP